MRDPNTAEAFVLSTIEHSFAFQLFISIFISLDIAFITGFHSCSRDGSSTLDSLRHRPGTLDPSSGGSGIQIRIPCRTPRYQRGLRHAPERQISPRINILLRLYCFILHFLHFRVFYPENLTNDFENVFFSNTIEHTESVRYPSQRKCDGGGATVVLAPMGTSVPCL